ncbi:discoidin domain-containing protein [Streptomyces thinghirensis]|nr:discoidin domain-containing protein [Streptomyces thinghirensis]
MDTGPDGSKRSAGVDGGYSTGIPGNVTDHVTDVRASAENTGGGEVKENLVDGEPGTKWLTFEKTGWVEFDLDEPAKIAKYALTSANDHDETRPGGLDAEGLGGRRELADAGHPLRGVLRRAVPDEDVRPRRGRRGSSTSRLEITKNNGAGDALSSPTSSQATAATDTPVPEDMLSLVDRWPERLADRERAPASPASGPSSTPAGYAADGRAYSYNRVFDVDVKVDRRTELSYKVFPSMADGDLDYDATNVSVDLAFTDGTYLSDLQGDGPARLPADAARPGRRQDPLRQPVETA